MIKTLVRAQKAERERFTVPHSVQDAIPIRRVWPDGIFQAGKQFSKTFSFTDINYSIAGKDEKTSMFLDYSELLNALDSGASAKITIHNRRLDKAEFERALLLPMKEDGLDGYRREYNEMLLSKVTGTNNSVVQERYFTVSVVKKNVDEARTWFSRVGTDLLTHLSRLSSVGRELDLPARLQIFRDFFREGEPAPPFDWNSQARRGHSFKDWFRSASVSICRSKVPSLILPLDHRPAFRCHANPHKLTAVIIGVRAGYGFFLILAGDFLDDKTREIVFILEAGKNFALAVVDQLCYLIHIVVLNGGVRFIGTINLNHISREIVGVFRRLAAAICGRSHTVQRVIGVAVFCTVRVNQTRKIAELIIFIADLLAIEKVDCRDTVHAVILVAV